MSEMLGTGKGGLDREHNGEENNTGRLIAISGSSEEGIFNEILQYKIKPNINEGEDYCKRCKGTGVFKDGICEKCWGAGILDWIDNAMSKPRVLYGTSSSSSSVQGTSGFMDSSIPNISISSKGHRTSCTGSR
jgi:hypothetical protein